MNEVHSHLEDLQFICHVAQAFVVHIHVINQDRAAEEVWCGGNHPGLRSGDLDSSPRQPLTTV